MLSFNVSWFIFREYPDNWPSPLILSSTKLSKQVVKFDALIFHFGSVHPAPLAVILPTCENVQKFPVRARTQKSTDWVADLRATFCMRLFKPLSVLVQVLPRSIEYS